MEYQRPLTPEESRRMSLVTGVMWLITFATSIPALWLFQPLLDDPAGYVMGAGDHDNRILLGAFLELLLIISNIATAVIPYPLLKRQHEGAHWDSSQLASWNPLSSSLASSASSRWWGCGQVRLAALVRTRSEASPTPSPRSRTGRSCSAPGSSLASGTDCSSAT
jgi:hypothetical protein